MCRVCQEERCSIQTCCTIALLYETTRLTGCWVKTLCGLIKLASINYVVTNNCFHIFYIIITTFSDGSTVFTGRKVRVESGYFSLEKTKSEPCPQPAQHSQPPLHLSLCSSASSSSVGALSPRYNSDSEPQLSPYQPSQDPLPSPGTLVSPSYSTISSSQSSLDSEPSGPTPSCEGGRESNGSTCVGGNRVGRSGSEYAALSDVPRARRLSYREAFRPEKKLQELRARTRSPGREEVARLFGQERR